MPLYFTWERSDSIQGTNLTSAYVCQQSSSPSYYDMVGIDNVQYVFQEEPSVVLYWFDMTVTLHWVRIKLGVCVECSTQSAVALLVWLHVEFLSSFRSNIWVLCWVDRASWIMCIITNSMHCLFLVCWIKIPLRVSGINSRSSGGKMYVCGKWYF
jgi:hypothetical protein